MIQIRRQDRMIAGVCGAIGAALSIDPTIIRIVYVLGTIVSVGLPGVVIYGLLWVLIPKA